MPAPTLSRELHDLLAREAPASRMSLEHKAVTMSVGQSPQDGLFGHQLLFLLKSDTTGCVANTCHPVTWEAERARLCYMTPV